MNRFIRHKYLMLLICIAALLISHPLLHLNDAEKTLWDVVITVLFAAAFLVIFTEKNMKIPALLLGVPTIAATWVGYTLPDMPRRPLGVCFHLVAGLFFVFTVASILRHIYREKRINMESVYGAFCGYILVGLAFGHFYAVIDVLAPGSFQVNGAPLQIDHEEQKNFFLLGYFSLITLTTVGYGDITPLNHGARGLAIVEAIVGQFYIAALIGDLIGKRVADSLAEREKSASPPHRSPPDQ